VSHGGRRYTWDGEAWYGTDDFKTPPQSLIPILDALIADRLHAEDATVSDEQDLLDRAKKARALGQLQRARALAERVHDANPSHVGAPAVLCSILREMGRAENALDVADRYRSSNYGPILTARAAALCDIGRWEEALRQINQVLAIDFRQHGTGSGEALAVRGRIKANAPELFDS
jgi:tetratricopeptide (TPR) repeat protein